MECLSFTSPKRWAGALRSCLVLCCIGAVVVLVAGCGSGNAASKTASHTSLASAAHDSYSGSLRNYDYEFHIWWKGERCERREIRIERDCGMCRGEITKAQFVDYDCDGISEQFITRAEHQNLNRNRRTLEEEAWHAFYLIVPPTQTGDMRSVLPENGVGGRRAAPEAPAYTNRDNR